MTEAQYLLHERIAIKVDSGIPEAEAKRQAIAELLKPQATQTEVAE